MKVAAVDAGERFYSLLKSLTTPENIDWLERTGLQFMEFCQVYWTWASGHMVHAVTVGADSAVAYYGSAQEFVINNFIKWVHPFHKILSCVWSSRRLFLLYNTFFEFRLMNIKCTFQYVHSFARIYWHTNFLPWNSKFSYYNISPQWTSNIRSVKRVGANVHLILTRHCYLLLRHSS